MIGFAVTISSKPYGGFEFWQGTAQLDLRVEAFLKMFETKLYELTDDEFKVRL